jgi:LysM repeat protein
VKLVVDPDESYADMQSSQDNNEEIDTKIEIQRVDSSNVNDVALETGKDTCSNNKVAVAKAIKQEKPFVKPVVSKSQLNKPKFIYHTVQPGDTLWNIAQRYQANVDQIKKANKISNSKNLRSGTRIKIPVKKG